MVSSGGSIAAPFVETRLTIELAVLLYSQQMNGRDVRQGIASPAGGQ